MRIATIDMGTNTFLLLVAEVTEKTITPLYQEEEIVRLGQGVDESGHLADAALARGQVCLERYLAKATDYGVAHLLACGTSALRDAANREAFAQMVRDRLGLQIQIISGDEEAALSWLGALSNKPDLTPPVYMLDIGGGSTELCWGTPAQLADKFSLDIGSVRLTERHLHHDPVLAEEIAAARAAVRQALQGQPAIARAQPGAVVGVAGTVTTLAAMQGKIFPYDADRIDGAILRLTEINELVRLLAIKSIKERQSLVGLPAKRADVILAGAIILEEMMQALHVSELVVSDRGLRFGIALAYARDARNTSA